MSLSTTFSNNSKLIKITEKIKNYHYQTNISNN